MTLSTDAGDGWDLRRVVLIQADQAATVPGLGQLADYVRRGLVPPTACYLVARRRTDAPWPDVVVAVPLQATLAQDWLRGDRSVARHAAEALETGYQRLMAHARSGRWPA